MYENHDWYEKNTVSFLNKLVLAYRTSPTLLTYRTFTTKTPTCSSTTTRCILGLIFPAHWACGFLGIFSLKPIELITGILPILIIGLIPFSRVFFQNIMQDVGIDISI